MIFDTNCQIAKGNTQVEHPLILRNTIIVIVWIPLEIKLYNIKLKFQEQHYSDSENTLLYHHHDIIMTCTLKSGVKIAGASCN